jgi:AcrR family transcriptional regulator
VREWIPVSTSAKGRLALRALEEFGRLGFEQVNVTELAAAVGVTTGSLYHHFGSKLGLYGFVRAEAEQRLLDRMVGAAAARRDDGSTGAVHGALLVGFDFVLSQGFLRLLGEPHPARDTDPVADLIAEITDRGRTPIGRMLAAAWRAALLAVADGAAPERARAGLAALELDETVLRVESTPQQPSRPDDDPPLT